MDTNRNTYFFDKKFYWSLRWKIYQKNKIYIENKLSLTTTEKLIEKEKEVGFFKLKFHLPSKGDEWITWRSKHPMIKWININWYLISLWKYITLIWSIFN